MLESTKLKKLNLSKLAVSPTDVCELLEAMGNLEELELCYMESLDFPSFCQVVKIGSNLKQISIFGCKQITLTQLFQVVDCKCVITAPEGQTFEFAVKQNKAMIHKNFQGKLNFTVGTLTTVQCYPSTGFPPKFSFSTLNRVTGMGFLPFFEVIPTSIGVHSCSLFIEGKAVVKLMKHNTNFVGTPTSFTLFGRSFCYVIQKVGQSQILSITENKKIITKVSVNNSFYQLEISEGFSINLALAIVFLCFLYEEKKL